MTVAELLQDIINQLPVEVFRRYGEPGILHAMNRLYKNLNRELKCLEKELSVTETTSGYSLPANWILPYAIDDDNSDLIYVNPEVFDATEDDTFTINKHKIYFGSADVTNTVKFDYYSSGKTLVRTVIPGGGDTQAASPEWPEESLHSILYYGVLTEIHKNYEGYRDDRAQFYMLKNALKETNYNRQAISPTRSVPHTSSPKNKYIDDYEKP